jgi:uncharacterized protein (DUF1015 family)
MVAWAPMALVKPFRALRYDAGAAGPLDDLVAPPHDVISPEAEERLLAASPYNAVRLARPRDAQEAARQLDEWRRAGVLVRERTPAVWILEEEFAEPDGSPRRRRGLAARVRLHPYEDGVVLPHERTFLPQKERRLELLRATRTKLSPVLLLHEGTPPPEPTGEPRLEAELDGVRSRLWAVDEPEEIERALGLVGGRLLIADGHHRYETALRFHLEDPSEETAYVLAVLVSRDDPGLAILPTHRLTAGPLPELDGGLRRTDLGAPEEALALLGSLPADRGAFVLLGPEGASLVEADGPALDTAVVDALPLEGVSFTSSAAEAEVAVATGAATAAFLVRPPTVEQVEAFALAGERMPPKSTYFYPKLATGLLFSPFDE